MARDRYLKGLNDKAMSEWYSWFAWYPVLTLDRGWVWLEDVHRRSFMDWRKRLHFQHLAFQPMYGPDVMPMSEAIAAIERSWTKGYQEGLIQGAEDYKTQLEVERAASPYSDQQYYQAK